MKQTIGLRKPERIVISQSVKNPDIYLNKLALAFPVGSETRRRIDAVRQLSSEEKSAWLLGLPRGRSVKPGERLEPASGCVMVVFWVTVAVVVYLGGKAVTQYHKEKHQEERCPQGGGSHSDDDDHDDSDDAHDDRQSRDHKKGCGCK